MSFIGSLKCGAKQNGVPNPPESENNNPKKNCPEKKGNPLRKEKTGQTDEFKCHKESTSNVFF